MAKPALLTTISLPGEEAPTQERWWLQAGRWPSFWQKQTPPHRSQSTEDGKNGQCTLVELSICPSLLTPLTTAGRASKIQFSRSCWKTCMSSGLWYPGNILNWLQSLDSPGTHWSFQWVFFCSDSQKTPVDSQLPFNREASHFSDWPEQAIMICVLKPCVFHLLSA